MDHENSPTIVNLHGSLTVEHAASLRDEISAALAASDNVLLNLSLVEDLDLACLQVFYAAGKSASAAEKRLHFVGTIPPRVVKRLAAAGLCKGASTSAEDFEAGLVGFKA